MKSQMKSADRCGARLAVIVGADEAEAGTCTVRNLSTSEQTVVQQSDLIQHLALVLGERQPRRNTQ
jgi:histidyl-tRNA synthetase